MGTWPGCCQERPRSIPRCPRCSSTLLPAHHCWKPDLIRPSGHGRKEMLLQAFGHRHKGLAPRCSEPAGTQPGSVKSSCFSPPTEASVYRDIFGEVCLKVGQSAWVGAGREDFKTVC